MGPEPVDSSAATAWDDWDAEDDDDAEEDTEAAAVARSHSHVSASDLSGFRGESGGDCIGGACFEASMTVRCTHCGYDVIRFSGYRWDESTDYYWVRNYAPDPRMPHRREEDIAKLSARLVRDATSAAMCCGCSWQSLSGQKPLDAAATRAAPHGGSRQETDPLLKWVAEVR